MKTWIKLLLVIVVGFVAELFLFPVKMSNGRGRHPSDTAVSFAKKPFIAGTSIPKQIHHTWKTSLRDASKRIKRNVRDWDSMNPGFDSNYYTDEKISDLVYDNFPDRTKLFERLNAIQRADLFRYLVLFHHGGIYADVDVQPEMSADEWVANARNSHHVITTAKTTSLSLDSEKAASDSAPPQKQRSASSTSPAAEKAAAATSSSSPPRQEVQSPAPHRGGEPKKVTVAGASSTTTTKKKSASASASAPASSLEDGEIGCMIGTEVVLPNQEVANANKYLGPIQFTQWAIACSPKHPILLSVLDMIEEKVEELTARYPDRKKLPTLETTGPFVWTRAIERYLKTLDVTLEDVHRIQYEQRGHSVRVGDVLLLAPCKFAKNKQWPDQCLPGDLNFIQHEFMGSWKVSEYNLAKKVVLILLSVTAAIVVLLTALYRLCKHHLEDDEPKEKFLPHPLTRSSSMSHLVSASGVVLGGGVGGGRSLSTSTSPASSALHSPASLSPRASHGHFSNHSHSHSPYVHHHQSHSHSHSNASHSHSQYHSSHSHHSAPSKSIGVSYASHYSLSATGLPSALTSSVASIPSTLASTAASALSLSAGSLSSTTSRVASTSSRPPSRTASYSTMPRVASCQVLPRASHSSLLTLPS